MTDGHADGHTETIRLTLASNLVPTDYEAVVYAWPFSRYLIWSTSKGLRSFKDTIERNLEQLIQRHKNGF